MNTSSFAMKSSKKRVTNGLICEGCQQEFKRAEQRIEHIINAHYACPWCSSLSYLDSGVWKELPDVDRQIRIDLIKDCAGLKKTSLWQCEACFALFHYAKTDHKCGVSHQVNLISGERLGIEVVLKTDLENTCNKCPKPRRLVTARACKNHQMRIHVTCPWCLTQLVKNDRSLKEISLQEREKAFGHFIECAQKNNESLFGCNTCFGVILCARTPHVDAECNGEVCQVSKKTKKHSDIVKQKNLAINQTFDWHEDDGIISSQVNELQYQIDWLMPEEDRTLADEFFAWYHAHQNGSVDDLHSDTRDSF